MDTSIIEKKFQELGARVKIRNPEPTRFSSRRSPFTIDIRKDKEGPFFDIAVQEEIKMLVLDTQKNDRHLLLMTKNPNPRTQNAKFLCGFDERDWFTCAVPEVRGIPVSTVFQAKEALKPEPLRRVEAQEGLKKKRAHKRHRKLNSGRKIHRQGEFMFIPEPDYQPPEGSLRIIHRNEPMRRGNGNAHYAQYLYRQGGERVYVSRYSPKAQNGLTEKEYRTLLKEKPEEARRFPWSTMVRNPQVYVKGKVTHKEHRTLDLKEIWHRVHLNTEDIAFGAKQVAFLD